ncbi:hypothetical protein [Streptomyces brasiliensis]|uniref:Uncharacterized protein n=1 Tax=Streptomyces brasiliensis TaxID=1954 RepID=A0A917KK90_9ACTN|nr:hypothetical protein [Streptomyces brasiliensis]GGJ15855.1 hypothetical protein GCM10010121_028200 [Streptomyces brasiliensis]
MTNQGFLFDGHELVRRDVHEPVSRRAGDELHLAEKTIKNNVSILRSARDTSSIHCDRK